MPLWTHLSLLDESRGRAERALSALGSGSSRDARPEMQLHAALAASLIWTRSAAPEVLAAWTKALEIAESLADAEYELRSLWGLWLYHLTRGKYRAALGLLSCSMPSLATRTDPADRLIGDRPIVGAQHLLGDQSSARRHIERVLAHYVPPIRRGI